MIIRRKRYREILRRIKVLEGMVEELEDYIDQVMGKYEAEEKEAAKD